MAHVTDNAAPVFIREDRRLRHRPGEDSPRLYQPPRGLSMSRPHIAAPSNMPDRRENAAASAEALFMRLVEAHLDGPVLRYSNRLRLLGLAGGLGIAPFRGRLLIALVQQARRRAVSGPARRRRWPAATALFLAIQAAILVLAWIVLA